MSKFAGSIPRLNTAAINAGSLRAAALQGTAEGSRRSGLDRALSIGVAAVKAREEALTASVNRRRAQSQIEESEQRLIQLGLTADLRKQQAILDPQ